MAKKQVWRGRKPDPRLPRTLPLSIRRRIRICGKQGCWRWMGNLSGGGSGGGGGYGNVTVGGRSLKVHRYVYELLEGPIGPGLQIDHRCRHRSCVNPAHLEAVSQAANTLRAVMHRNLAASLRQLGCGPLIDDIEHDPEIP